MNTTLEQIQTAVATHCKWNQTRTPTLDKMVQFVSKTFPNYIIKRGNGKNRVIIYDGENHLFTVHSWTPNIEFAYWINRQVVEN